MTWWLATLLMIVVGFAITFIGGLSMLIPAAMAWCFAFGFELLLNHGDWQVPLGVTLIGMSVAYGFVILHRLAYGDRGGRR